MLLVQCAVALPPIYCVRLLCNSDAAAVCAAGATGVCAGERGLAHHAVDYKVRAGEQRRDAGGQQGGDGLRRCQHGGGPWNSAPKPSIGVSGLQALVGRIIQSEMLKAVGKVKECWHWLAGSQEERRPRSPQPVSPRRVASARRCWRFYGGQVCHPDPDTHQSPS